MEVSNTTSTMPAVKDQRSQSLLGGSTSANSAEPVDSNWRALVLESSSKLVEKVVSKLKTVAAKVKVCFGKDSSMSSSELDNIEAGSPIGAPLRKEGSKWIGPLLRYVGKSEELDSMDAGSPVEMLFEKEADSTWIGPLHRNVAKSQRKTSQYRCALSPAEDNDEQLSESSGRMLQNNDQKREDATMVGVPPEPESSTQEKRADRNQMRVEKLQPPSKTSNPKQSLDKVSHVSSLTKSIEVRPPEWRIRKLGSRASSLSSHDEFYDASEFPLSDME